MNSVKIKRSLWEKLSLIDRVEFYPFHMGLEDKLVVNAGNYFFSDGPQGAYLYGFRLFRELLDHFNFPQPRRLKGES